MIARCAPAADVATALDFAGSSRLEIAVRGGGHNPAGHCVVDGGLVIDLSRMRSIEVDAYARIARAEGGATWLDFDTATQKHGLVTPGGVVGSTGVGGLTLGGGIGHLTTQYGLNGEPAEMRALRSEAALVDNRVRAQTFLEQQLVFTSPYGEERNYWRGHFVRELPDELLDALLSQVVALGHPPSNILFESLHGAPKDTAADGAVGFRRAALNVSATTVWREPERDVAAPPLRDSAPDRLSRVLRRLLDVREGGVGGAAGSVSRPGAMLIAVSDISTASGLDGGSIRRALAAMAECLRARRSWRALARRAG